MTRGPVQDTVDVALGRRRPGADVQFVVNDGPNHVGDAESKNVDVVQESNFVTRCKHIDYDDDCVDRMYPEGKER